MHYFDLSQPIENGMTFYPGDPEPRLVPVEPSSEWRVTQLQMVTHTGTHVDAAAHFIAGGRTIDRYPLERFLLPGIVVPVQADAGEAIEAAALADHLALLPAGGAVILRTGWGRYWKHEHYLRHPYLARTAAQLLVERGASLVGVDMLSVDSTLQETSDAHAVLLGHDVLIVENLAHLEQLQPATVYRFSFLPLALNGLDGSPVRAVAWQDEDAG